MTAAAPLLLEAQGTLQGAVGAAHPSALYAAQVVAALLGAQGRAREALAALQSAHALGEAKLGSSHPRVHSLALALGEAYAAAGAGAGAAGGSLRSGSGAYPAVDLLRRAHEAAAAAGESGAGRCRQAAEALARALPPSSPRELKTRLLREAFLGRVHGALGPTHHLTRAAAARYAAHLACGEEGGLGGGLGGGGGGGSFKAERTAAGALLRELCKGSLGWGGGVSDAWGWEVGEAEACGRAAGEAIALSALLVASGCACEGEGEGRGAWEACKALEGELRHSQLRSGTFLDVEAQVLLKALH